MAFVLGSVLAFNTSYYLTRLADQGFAHLCGLTTFRLGMDPISWIGVHLLGTRGAIRGVKDGEAMNLFFLLPKCNGFQLKRDIFYRTNIIASRFCFLFFPYLSSSLQSKIKKISILFCAFVACLIPSIKLRIFKHQKSKISGEREKSSREEKSTKPTFPPWRFGLIGTIWAVVSGNVSFNQGTACCPGYSWSFHQVGCAFLVAAGVGMFGVRGWLASHKTAAIAGAILACL